MASQVEIFKALANDARLDILKWLGEPDRYFIEPAKHATEEVRNAGGVCVRDIHEKANMSQSTVSHYLQILQRAGLVESERVGQWTYYRRNEETMKKIAHFISEEL
ncbi:metalloregulator ArsR/SmtB family transcription factor [Corynebacterium callunae]|uniref:ArsR/SmtB family transcription factor n=1 Tax=Corynebacterium callunae TaxID=1721 RepID=UPI003981BD93